MVMQALGNNWQINYDEYEDYEESDTDTSFGDLFYHYNRNPSVDFNIPLNDELEGEYRGDYLDDKFHGRGILVDDDGNTYDGDFKYGYCHGTAHIVFNCIGTYNGDVKYNLPDGRGKLKSIKNEYYVGEFRNGICDGYGQFFSDSMEYEGLFESGFFHGDGVLSYHNHEILKIKGTWFRGLLSGTSLIEYKNGSFYKGETRKNLPDGKGEMYYLKEKEKEILYSGNFKKGVFHGYGTIYEKNSTSNYFYGEFKNGKKNGYGELFINNKKIFYGYWNEDKKNGFGRQLGTKNRYLKKYYIDDVEWDEYHQKYGCNEEKDKCPICINNFRKNSIVIKLDCKHCFHSDCLQTWFTKNRSCPVCRAEIKLVRPSRKRKLEE